LWADNGHAEVRNVSCRNPLPSWNDGEARAAILDFIGSVTAPGGDFVPVEERVATFDNDGTLWCEKPTYVQADFFMRRWRQMVEADSEKAKEQPYKAVVENDRAWLAGLPDHVPEIVKGVTEAYEGITTGAFEQVVEEFFTTAVHPTLGVPYTQVGYRPMRELLDLLAANGFTVYICSGGGRDFVRPVARSRARSRHGCTASPASG
jgi:phosphoglycolate phosphatase-like HAD superfamily hydrolase